MTEHSCIADYGVVLISGLQQRESVSRIPVLFFFFLVRKDSFPM